VPLGRVWDPGLLRKVPVSETVQNRTPGAVMQNYTSVSVVFIYTYTYTNVYMHTIYCNYTQHIFLYYTHAREYDHDAMHYLSAMDHSG